MSRRKRAVEVMRWSARAFLRGALLLLPFLCVACTEADSVAPEGPSFSVTDSAGVELAVTTYSEPVPSTGWTIGDAPVVVYGESGDDPVQFMWIRDALRLPDGRVVAIDGQANEIFFFAPSGELTARAGGTGDGPGEFDRPAGLAALGGDTMLVFDSGHQRFSLFDAGGNLLDARRLEPPEGGEDAPRINLYGMAGAAGDTVVLTGEGYAFAMGTADFVWESPTMRYTTHGSYVDEVAEPMKMWFFGTDHFPQTMLFGGSQRVGAGGGRIYVKDRESYEIRIYEPDRGLVRIDRLQRQRRPVTDEAIARYRDWRASRVEDPDRLQQMLERIDQGPVADSIAWISDFFVDRLGHVWVTEYHITGEDPEITTVFSADGRWLGRVAAPPDFEPLDIGEDYLLGARTDELDVQHLHLYRLER